MRLGVEKDWIYSHNVSEIKIVRCDPYYEMLTAVYVNETEKEGIYDVYSDNGFSTWAIIGTFSLEENIPSSLGELSDNKLPLPWSWLLIILIILIMFVLFRKRKPLYEKVKINNKWFNFNLKKKPKLNKPIQPTKPIKSTKPTPSPTNHQTTKDVLI